MVKKRRRGKLMKVLLLAATTGGGHMRAANALKEYILSRDSDAIVKIYDTIQYVSPLFNKAVTNGYVYLATKTPGLFGSLYKGSDKNNTPFNKTVELTFSSFRKRLLPMIEEFAPDVVITTHSFACEMICGLKVSEGLHFPVINILTDFAVSSCDCLNEFSVFVCEDERKAVKFPAKEAGMFTEPFS